MQKCWGAVHELGEVDWLEDDDATSDHNGQKEVSKHRLWSLWSRAQVSQRCADSSLSLSLSDSGMYADATQYGWVVAFMWGLLNQHCGPTYLFDIVHSQSFCVTSTLQVEVYSYVLDNQVCDECQGMHCNGRYAPYFCGSIHCLRYYCEHCWATIHSAPCTKNHRCFIKENGIRPWAINFFPSQARLETYGLTQVTKKNKKGQGTINFYHEPLFMWFHSFLSRFTHVTFVRLPDCKPPSFMYTFFSSSLLQSWSLTFATQYDSSL